MTSLSLDEARTVLDAALERAAGMAVPSSVAIVDAGGHVVIKARMDGVPFITVRMSEDKAYTAAALNEPSANLHASVQPGQALYGLPAAEAGRIICFGGGIPLQRQGAVVGAIGVAGDTVDDDIEIAEAGVRRWESLVGGAHG